MSTTLGQVAVGSIVTLNENGAAQNYIVVHQGIPDSGLYDASCNGTWLLRQNIYANASWNSTNNNTFTSATINTNYLPNLISVYDVGIATSIKTVKIPYCVGNGSSTVNSGSNGWECKLFLLGGYELGWTNSDFPIDGEALSYFQNTTIDDPKRIAYFNGNATIWWMRTPYLSNNSQTRGVAINGSSGVLTPTTSYGIRPAMILPQTMTVNDDNSIAVPSITMGQAPVGSIVKVKESGVPVDYIVVNQGIPQDSPLYDSSCDGTWLLRKDVYANAIWDAGNENAYKPSDVNTSYLPNTILPLYDTEFQNIIKQVKIPYVNGTGSGGTVASGANGLSTKLFLLGGYEVGWTTSTQQYIPVDGAVLSYFQGTASIDSKRIAYLDNIPAVWWLRSSVGSNVTGAWIVLSTGGNSSISTNRTSGIRPAFIIPSTIPIDSDGNVLSSAFTITVPQLFMDGQSIPISWTPWQATGTVTYTIQRSVDGGEFITIASNLSTTTYTDTVGTGWNQVQYQIASVIDDVIGPYIPSDIIPGVASAVLAISGIDGNLGTITSNIQYTVVSNTGNTISLTRTVNGAQVVTIEVDSGFSYNIPIADLPTGTGTIMIMASVEDTSQQIQITTRTWTYYKTPINIPSTGGIAQLTQNGQNIWPVTVPDAVEAPVYLGGNLNSALNKLGQAVLYSKIGALKYNEVNINLANVSVGDEVNLPYNGVMVPHIVVQIGNPDASIYDSSCDGVWLLRKDCVAKSTWNSSNINTLNGSTIMSTMAGYVANYDMTIQSAMKTVKIPYCVGDGNTTVNTLVDGLSCQIFPLSGYEVGWTINDSQYLPVDGTVLSYFQGTSSVDSKRIAYFENNSTDWWTRSPRTSNNNLIYTIGISGEMKSTLAYGTKGIRPTFILPATFTATYYVDSNNNVYPSQEYSQSSVITDVFGYDVPMSQIETGSYQGTGTYGVDNPNSLVCSFIPKLVIIYSSVSNSFGIMMLNSPRYFSVHENSSNVVISEFSRNFLSLSGNTISWYSTMDVNFQLNSVATHYYVILG